MLQLKKHLILSLLILLSINACQQALAADQTIAPPRIESTATSIPIATTIPEPIVQCNISTNPKIEFEFIDEDLIKSYLAFLNNGGDWQKLLVFSAHRIQSMDINQDQELDFLFESQNTAELILCTEKGYQAHSLNQELITPNRSTVQMNMLTYGDFNQNFVPEFILEAPFCDRNYCYNHLEIIEWRKDSFENILDQSTDDILYPQATLEKVEGTYQLILKANPIETTNSGPIRAQEIRYAPASNDGHWQRISQNYNLSPYRMHYLIDGEIAYAAGDFELAKAFYLSVIYDQSLLDYKAELYPQQIENIIATAQMRLVELHFRAGEVEEAKQLYQWMDDNYAYGTPAFRIRGLARTWVLEYEENGIQITHEKMKEYIDHFEVDLDDLFAPHYYGVFNPTPFQILCNEEG